MDCRKNKSIRLLTMLLTLCLLAGCGASQGPEGGQAPNGQTSGGQGSAGQTSGWKQALFSAPDRKEKTYYLAAQVPLGKDAEAAILESCLAAAKISPEGCRVDFCSREDGRALGSAVLSGSYETCEVRAGRQDEALIFLEPSGADVREVWLADAEGNTERLGSIGPFDLPDAPFPPTVKDVGITEDGTVFVRYSVYIRARDTGLERHQDVPEDALYLIDRIYVLDEKAGVRGPASEPEEVVLGRVTADGYEMTVKGEDGWSTETVKKDGSLSPQEAAKAAPWLEGSDSMLQWTLEGTLWYIKDNALWKQNGSAEEGSRAFDLADFGRAQEEIKALRVDGGGRIGLLAQSEGETSYLCIAEGEDEVTVLTLADIDTEMSPLLREVVTDFNRTHQDCRVEIVDYLAEASDYDDAVTKLHLDLSRGNAPDLLVTSSMPDGAVYSEKGMLCDLYGFMEDDEEVNRETVVPSVLRAYEENGGLYVLAPNFVLSTLYGPKSIVGDDMRMNLEGFRKLLAENPDKDVSIVLGLDTLLCAGMDDFIDWETGTCNFDCEEFRELLKFTRDDLASREYVLPEDSYGNAQLYEDYRNGRIMLTIGRIEDVCDYSLMREMFGQDITLIGYPTSSGSGACIQLTPAEVSIMSASQNQDRAWEFLKYYCSYVPSGPDYSYYQDDFSILSSRLEEQMKESQTPRYSINEFGQQEKTPRASGGDTYHTISYNIYEASKEDADAVAALIENSDTRYGIYSSILLIIREEVEPYMEGQKTAEEVSRIVQGRLSIYLAE